MSIRVAVASRSRATRGWKSCASIALAALSLLSGSAASAQALNQRLLVPLYESYSAQYNDYFYTIDRSQHDQAVQIYGYTPSTRPIAYVEERDQLNSSDPLRTMPLMRYYKGHPDTDHFYTWKSAEGSQAVSYGYDREINGCATCFRDEGLFYTYKVPGSVPMYRLNQWNPATGDSVHRFTRSYAEVQILRQQGWSLDPGIAGWVYESKDGSIPNGAIIGMRCPKAGCWWTRVEDQPTNYRDYFSSAITVKSTPKPVGAVVQVITFNFTTPDYFGSGNDHIVFGGHGEFNQDKSNVINYCKYPTFLNSCTHVRGHGFIIYQNGAFDLESWYHAPSLIGATQKPQQVAFRNNTTYSAMMVISDAGQIDVEIYDGSTGAVVVSRSWNTAGVNVGNQPRDLTGYFFTSANQATRDYTVYITNVGVSWY